MQIKRTRYGYCPDDVPNRIAIGAFKLGGRLVVVTVDGSDTPAGEPAAVLNDAENEVPDVIVSLATLEAKPPLDADGGAALKGFMTARNRYLHEHTNLDAAMTVYHSRRRERDDDAAEGTIIPDYKFKGNGWFKLPSAAGFAVYAVWSPSGLAEASSPACDPGRPWLSATVRKGAGLKDLREALGHTNAAPVWTPSFSWERPGNPPMNFAARRFVLIKEDEPALRFLVDLTEGNPYRVYGPLPCIVMNCEDEGEDDEFYMRCFIEAGGPAAVPKSLPDIPRVFNRAYMAATHPWDMTFEPDFAEPLPLGGFLHTVAGWWLRTGSLDGLRPKNYALNTTMQHATVEDVAAFVSRAAVEAPALVQAALCHVSARVVREAIGARNPSDPFGVVEAAFGEGYAPDGDAVLEIFHGWVDPCNLMLAAALRLPHSWWDGFSAFLSTDDGYSTLRDFSETEPAKAASLLHFVDAERLSELEEAHGKLHNEPAYTSVVENIETLKIEATMQRGPNGLVLTADGAAQIGSALAKLDPNSFAEVMKAVKGGAAPDGRKLLLG